MKPIAVRAGHLLNKWLALAIILSAIFCINLSPADSVSAQLCPERWEVSLQGIKTTYQPGEAIDFSVNYLTRNPSDCSACRQQIIVGMVNAAGKVIYVSCVYDGSPLTCPKETSGTGKISWKIPSDIGAYQILAANDYQNSCEDAKGNFRVKSSNRLLATIQVSTSGAAASSPKSTGSDTTGSTQNPFSKFQAWLQQITNPTSTGTTTPATTPTSPASASGNPMTSFVLWFQQNQKTIFSVFALVTIVALGLRYLLNRKRGDTDKVITIILGAVAVGYLLIIWVIIPIIDFIRVHWQAILISLLAVAVIAVLAWKKGWIKLSQSSDLNLSNPNNDDNEIIKITNSLEQYEAWLFKQSPERFEHYIEQLFRDMGFQNVERTQFSRDGGIDVKATKSDKFGFITNYVVQCKRYISSSPAGTPDLQAFLGTVEQQKRSLPGAVRGVYICTRGFSQGAENLATQFDIQCWGVKRLYELHKEHWKLTKQF